MAKGRPRTIYKCIDCNSSMTSYEARRRHRQLGHKVVRTNKKANLW